MIGKYKIAGFNVTIESIYNLVHIQCAGYKCDNIVSPDIHITTSQNDIEEQRDRLCKYEVTRKDNTDEYIETLAICRKFSDIITSKGCLIIKGCAISAYGTAYIFTPDFNLESKYDKKLWLSGFGKRAEIINGKYPILRAEKNNVYVYSSPWSGCDGIINNTFAPLSGICIINSDTTNHIEEISLADGYAALLRQCYNFTAPADIPGTISNLKRILKSTALYSLGCNMEPSAAVVAYEAMKKKIKNTIL